MEHCFNQRELLVLPAGQGIKLCFISSRLRQLLEVAESLFALFIDFHHTLFNQYQIWNEIEVD